MLERTQRLQMDSRRPTNALRVLVIGAMVAMATLAIEGEAREPPAPPQSIDPDDFDVAADEKAIEFSPDEEEAGAEVPPDDVKPTDPETDPATDKAKTNKASTATGTAEGKVAAPPRPNDDDNGYSYDDAYREPEDSAPTTSQDREEIVERPASNPAPDVSEVVLAQAGAATGVLLLGGGPLLILSYCSGGIFGCCLWPGLQGAFLAWIGNGVAEQKRGVLIPALAGIAATLATVVVGGAIALITPGASPFVPPIPGFTPQAFVIIPAVVILSAPVWAAVASVTAWHLDDEGIYDPDPWSTIPPFFTTPVVKPELEERPDENGIPQAPAPAFGMRF